MLTAKNMTTSVPDKTRFFAILKTEAQSVKTMFQASLELGKHAWASSLRPQVTEDQLYIEIQ